MKKRTFLALPLTSGLKAKIGFLEKEIEKELKRKIPWIPLKNLHLTILFLGYLSQEDILKILEILKSLPRNFLPLNLKIKKIDYGPPGKKRMIWLYPEKNQKLVEIKKFFENVLSLKGIVYQKEEREFLPHINLVRLKNIFPDKEIKKDLNWSVVFNEIVFYESHLKKGGTEYEKIKTIRS